MAQEIKLMRRHINRIKELSAEGYTIEELYRMYKVIPAKQLRSIVKGVKKQPRI